MLPLSETVAQEFLMANIPPLLAPKRAAPVAPTSQAQVNARKQRQGGQGHSGAQDSEHKDHLEDPAADQKQAGAHKTIGALQRPPASSLQHVSDAPFEDEDVAHLAQDLAETEQEGDGRA
jgi:hypothetical protein